MDTRARTYPSQFEDARAISADRDRLLRFCTRYTGNSAAAEDLAQQTLLEALEHGHELRNPDARRSWLFGIARNQCLLWARGRGREVPSLTEPDGEREIPGGNPWQVGDVDLEMELERDELARLLDRAMAQLPPETRDALVWKYIEESPQAEVAERLRLTEGAVEARLHRGKLALRRILTTELGEAAAAYGLAAASDTGWEETRIYCPQCGRHRLRGRFDRDTPDGRFQLHCPDCHPDPAFAVSNTHVGYGHFRDLLGGMRAYKPALSRLLAWVHGYYARGLEDGVVGCAICGRTTRLWAGLPDTAPPYARGFPGLHVRCEGCAEVICAESVFGLALSVPEARRFWREHPRIRTLPAREVEAGGVPALVIMFESLTGPTRLDVMVSRETLRVLGTYGASVAGA